MKKLKFLIKRNGKTIKSEVLNYIKKEDIIVFYFNKIRIVINKANKSLIRETKEDSLYLSKDESFIFLKIENIKFNIELDKFDFIIKENIIIITYKIKGDEETVKVFIDIL